MTTEFRCGPFVVARIQQLTGTLPSRLTPAARAMLAQLREGAAYEPGAAPSIWAITAEGVPELPEPQKQRVETAIHVALTQYAIHQQARGERMHVPHRSFGSAIRRLAETQSAGEPYDTPVYRRFTAMAAATTIDGLLPHARGLITQLRGADIGFDYGRYADDLYWLQLPGRSAGVRRGWGRAFHYLTTDPNDTADQPATAEGA